jgi:hypothetical protein
VQFHTEIDGVYVKFDPEETGIKPLYTLYKGALDNERVSLDFVRKSELTIEIAAHDHARDKTLRGFFDAIKSNLNHFDPTYANAAYLLSTLSGHYGNIGKKTLDDETAAITNLLTDMAQPEPAQAITLLGLTPWVTRLSQENTAFSALMRARYVETAGKTPLRMVDTRVETDRYYHAIVNQIESMKTAGLAVEEAFIREWNAVIERFKSILAQELAERQPPPNEN